MEPIVLSDDLFLGQGVHRAAYIDPRDSSRCIKILFHTPDGEWEREKRYRRSRKRRHLSSTMLTAYYGEVATNKGTGYVFERVADFDGKPSLHLGQFFQRQRELTDQKAAVALTERVLVAFKDDFFREKIVVSNMHVGNFLVQAEAADFSRFRVRCIDNIGTPNKIPLAFWLDWVALKRCKRYWLHFLSDMQHDYPDIMTESLRQKLLP